MVFHRPDTRPIDAAVRYDLVAPVTVLQMRGGGMHPNRRRSPGRSNRSKKLSGGAGVSVLGYLSRPKLRRASSYGIVFVFSGQRIAKRTGGPPVRKVQVYAGQSRDRIGWSIGGHVPVVRSGVDNAGAAQLGEDEPAHQ
jgi:hypothetical protein